MTYLISLSLYTEMKQMNLTTGKERLIKRAPFSISAFRYRKRMGVGVGFFSLFSFLIFDRGTNRLKIFW